MHIKIGDCEMLYYTIVKLSFGQVGLVWQPIEPPLLVRVILPENDLPTRSVIRQCFPEARAKHDESIDEICHKLKEYDQGKDIKFSLPAFELNRRGDFYSRVWTETCNILRGTVSTYGQVARGISSPKAARAVGTALAGNPLPLLVPCHRVIRADRTLSGFGGGTTQAWIKRHLLEREGVTFDNRGRVANVIKLEVDLPL